MREVELKEVSPSKVRESQKNRRQETIRKGVPVGKKRIHQEVNTCQTLARFPR